MFWGVILPFDFKRLEIPDLVLITPKIFKDERGFFLESYKESEFKRYGLDLEFKQENLSMSKKGVFRGLHYQLAPKSQGKLVRCVKGSILDIVVDIRKNSPYYAKYVSSELSAENKHMLWVPPGFAHGFLALEDDTVVLYKTDEEYSPDDDKAIAWNDPDINIKWPIGNPKLSEKDAKAPLLKDTDNNLVYKI